MRKIEFRGKRIDTCTWVYGYLREIWAPIGSELMYVIAPSHRYENDGVTDRDETEVIPETVGQYVGLQIENGVKIFDADILKDKSGKHWLVYWDVEALAWFVKGGDTAIPLADLDGCTKIELIGNAIDNKRLLEVK
jgi:hypothetical protein